VNLIPTALGGTHEAGLRNAVYESIKEFCEHHELLTRGVSLQSEDAWKPLRYLLSARILDPQFQGQTKERLSSRESVKLIASRVKDPLDAWLNQNVEEGKKIAQLAISAATARQKAGKVVEKRRGSGSRCSRQAHRLRVAGHDAQRGLPRRGRFRGGSAKQGRDRQYQAILPLQGKVLNTFEVGREGALRQRRGARHRGGARHRSRTRPTRPTRSSTTCATARSSSWRTRTWTARTSRRSSSRSSIGISRS
jgi:topoisomerase-4 subunit B